LEIFPGRFRETAFTGVGGLYAAGVGIIWHSDGLLRHFARTGALEFFVNLEPNDALTMSAGEAEIQVSWSSNWM